MTKTQKGLICGAVVGVGSYFAYKQGFLDFIGGGKVESNKTGAAAQSNKSLYYGVTGGNAEILNIIDEVTRHYNFGANQNNLSKFLFEICAVESDFGEAIDRTRNSGEGLTQFDRATYNELRDDAIKNKLIVYNIANTEYNALRTNPKLQIFMARYFIYRRIPQAIPADIAGRAKQWKKYYNTHLGAGTESGYIAKANKWYNKLGYKGV